MANPVSNPDTQRNGADADRLGRLVPRGNNGPVREKTSQDTPLPPGLNGWDRREGGAEPGALGSPDDLSELEQLRLENADLRRSVAELRNALEELQPMEENWGRQQKEYEGLLEEKSEVIRTLHHRLQEVQEAAGQPQAPAPREEELLSLHDELERERRQLKEDEESLMRQMR